LATVIPDIQTPKALQLIENWETTQTQIFAPVLFHYELAAVLRKHVYRGTLAKPIATQWLEMLTRRSITLIYDTPLIRRAHEIATQLNQPTAYDSQYLALAERLDCEFWTADKRLYNTAQPHFAWVHWIGEL